MARRKATPKASAHDIQLAWLEALMARNNGHMSPRILLDEARDESSPLHDQFCWDDDEAAEQYRLIQAGQIIRRWKGSVIRINSEQRTVTFEPVRRAQSPANNRSRGGASYRTIDEIMADPDQRDDMLRTVLRELQAYRRRYASIEALSSIWRAIDDAIDLHGSASFGDAVGDGEGASPPPV